jgi:hypothetical protein
MGLDMSPHWQRGRLDVALEAVERELDRQPTSPVQLLRAMAHAVIALSNYVIARLPP